jgi:hypothetical protein
MLPIIIDGESGIAPGELGAYLEREALIHQAEGRARAFAYIAYDFRDQNINKILSDQDYWSSLHHLSGKYLTIFYLCTPEHHESLADDLDPAATSNTFESEPRLNYMLGVPYSTQQHREDANAYLREHFGIRSHVRQPLVIFFHSEDSRFYPAFAVQLKQHKVEESFAELKACISDAVNATKAIADENWDHAASILREVERSVKQGRQLRFVKTKAAALAVHVMVAVAEHFITDGLSSHAT